MLVTNIGKSQKRVCFAGWSRFRLVFVRPSAPSRWVPTGRLRVLVAGAADRDANGLPLLNISAQLNGVQLRPTTNVSSQYDEGGQATLGLWPPESWRAFDVPCDHTFIVNLFRFRFDTARFLPRHAQDKRYCV